MAYAVSGENRRWTDGIVPYVISADFTVSQRSTIRDAIRHWNEKTILRLVSRGSQADFVLFVPADGSCSSSVGRVGGEQHVGCDVGDGFSTGSVIHEIGHAVGYHHEQQRPDRDQFVTVVEENIKDGKGFNFHIRFGGTVLSPYDYSSIMHYGRAAFADGGDTIVPPQGVSIGQREGLSAFDISGTCVMYGAPHFTVAFEDDEDVASRSTVRWTGLTRWGKGCWEPLRVHDNVDVHQSSPSVGIDAERTSVVVWQEGLTGGSIRARCRAIDGADRFDLITVASGGRHSAPDIAMHSGGNFVVVWQTALAGGGQEIRARGFGRQGEERFAEIVASAGASGVPGAAAVAMDSDGRFAVAWGELLDESLSVHVRGFDESGTVRFDDVTVATGLGDQDVFSRIGMASDGSFVVVYERRMRDVLVRGFNADGSERFSEMTVNVNPVGAQVFADAVVSPSGRTMVVWTDDRNENTLGQLRMRAFNPDGSEALAEFTGNPRGGGDQLRPRLAVTVDGTTYLVWEDDEDRNGLYQIHATGLRANRTRLLRRLTVNKKWAGQQRRPAIASR